MQIDVDGLPAASLYKLLIGSVVPRPIAWVSSVSAQGDLNIAPFSFFTAVSDNPPLLAISIGNDRRNGLKKDTLSNIESMKDFVVNIVSHDLADPMNMTATEFEPDIDEFAAAGLSPVASVHSAAPRIAQAPISMECRLDRIIELGHGPHRLVIGEVLCFHIRDDLYDSRSGRIDMAKLDPIARMAGHFYSRTQLFEMTRKESDYRG